MTTSARCLALAAAAVLVSVASACDGDQDREGAPRTAATAPAPPQRAVAASTATPARSGDPFARIPRVVQTVQPSVVSVVTTTANGGAEGSGVIWDRRGAIVTNAHVVEGARKVEVVLLSGARIPVTVQASSTAFDLAVLRARRQGLPAARFAARLPRVGELAIAMGNPLGFENTVTAGIVSGLHRSIPSGGRAPGLVDLLQTDAPISPGNSGGALVTLDGAVVGINVAYLPPGETGAVSLGFAIPAPTVRHVVQELLRTGHVEVAYLGVEPVQVTPDLARQLNLPVEEGVAVRVVGRGTPAARAGVKEGDVVVRLAGRNIATVEDLFAELRRRRPGDRVSVTVVRGGSRRTLAVVLGGRER